MSHGVSNAPSVYTGNQDVPASRGWSGREGRPGIWNKAGHTDGSPACSPQSGHGWRWTGPGDSPGQLPMPRAAHEGHQSDRRPTLPGAEEVPTTDHVQLSMGEAPHREREELVTSCLEPRPTRVSPPLELQTMVSRSCPCFSADLVLVFLFHGR